MSQHPASASPIARRHCDVCIVGGSAAGLAAALQIGRQRRSVIVIDDGEPRNAAAAHMHGYLTREALAPAELLARGREEVHSYGVEVLAGRVARVERAEAEPGGFHVELASGGVVSARRVLAATGIVDELPDIDGLREHWGAAVIHCPFCHGYEVRDRRLIMILSDPLGLHSAMLFRHLTSQLTVVVDDPAPLSDELDELQASGVDLRHGSVRRLLTAPDGSLSGVELANGERLAADAVAVLPRFRARATAFASLGLSPTPHPSGIGDVIATDATGSTAVAGLYAAGNVTDPGLQVLPAAADGSRVGAMISISLAAEDMAAAARPSGNETDWDRRYGGERLWSGNPNGTFVNETTAMAPGRALDVGAGEGADSLWLADRGWQVTASDISERALARISAEAERRGLRLTYLHTDANAPGAFPAGVFDLVSVQYPSIPRTADGRGLQNLIDAVSPGGTLLVVGHDLTPLRAPAEPHGGGRMFDPDAYVGIEDIAAVLSGSRDWTIELQESRPRPAGAATGHHVDDVVLRARRVPVGAHQRVGA